MGRNVFTYIDDIVVASIKKDDHLSDLAKTLANMREARLCLNPKNAFLVSAKARYLAISYHIEESKPTPAKFRLSWTWHHHNQQKTYND
jgi:hypothetical protein